MRNLGFPWEVLGWWEHVVSRQEWPQAGQDRGTVIAGHGCGALVQFSIGRLRALLRASAHNPWLQS